jgi:hypothetical protein
MHVYAGISRQPPEPPQLHMYGMLGFLTTSRNLCGLRGKEETGLSSKPFARDHDTHAGVI